MVVILVILRWSGGPVVYSGRSPVDLTRGLQLLLHLVGSLSHRWFALSAVGYPSQVAISAIDLVSVGFPLLPSARSPLVIHRLVHSRSAVGYWFDSPLGQFVAISPTVYVDRRLVAVDSCLCSIVFLSAIFPLLSAVV